jgi:hypothetical protein
MPSGASHKHPPRTVACFATCSQVATFTFANGAFAPIIKQRRRLVDAAAELVIVDSATRIVRELKAVADLSADSTDRHWPGFRHFGAILQPSSVRHHQGHS